MRTITDQTARRGALDRAAPNNPVMLTLCTGYGVFFNGAALVLLDLGDKPADPLGGRDEDERGTSATDMADALTAIKTSRNSDSSSW